MRGIILYEDRVRVAILTLRSDNAKTGDMAQAWILSRNVNPFSASITGTDKHVCGDCKHRFRALGTCYVNLARAPTSVWKAYHRGLYRPATPKDLRRIRGKEIRLGAYGDPAFVPFDVWRRLLDASSAEHTGYTHQWRSCDPRFKQIVMASVDSLAERAEAKTLGWRTFRIRNEGEKIVRGEMQCPAAAEAGHAEQCIGCPSKCSGGEGRDAGIIVHGMLRKRFLPVVVSLCRSRDFAQHRTICSGAVTRTASNNIRCRRTTKTWRSIWRCKIPYPAQHAARRWAWIRWSMATWTATSSMPPGSSA